MLAEVGMEQDWGPMRDQEATYLWRTPDEYPAERVAKLRVPVGGSGELAAALELMPPLLCSVEFQFRGRLAELQELDCLPNDTQQPLVGPRVAAVLRRQAKGDVELVPALIDTPDGPCQRHFYLAHVVWMVQAMDRERSVYHEDAGTVHGIRLQQLAHRAGCLGRHRIARDTEFPSQVIASGELAYQVWVLAPSGVVFREPGQLRF